VLQYLSTSRDLWKKKWEVELTDWISVIIADFTISHEYLRFSHSNSSNSHYQPEDRYGHRPTISATTLSKVGFYEMA
jgi:hypothetical protein